MDTFEITWQWAGGHFTSFERIEAHSAQAAVNALHRRLRRDFESASGEVVVAQVERLEPVGAAAGGGEHPATAHGGTLRGRRGFGRFSKRR